jgi:D-tyrosyl-tRNA(Tyr) deacylase
MSNKEQMLDAISQHGAKAVYDAASARMSGNRKPLEVVGLDALTIGDANAIMVLAFANMGASDRAHDLAGATIKAAKI